MDKRKYSNYFPVGATIEGRDARRGPKYDLAGNLAQVLNDQSIPQVCKACGSNQMKYEGLGRYVCEDCATFDYDNYGKVRECISTYGTITVREIIAYTGLTRGDIQALVDSGSVILVGNGLKCV